MATHARQSDHIEIGGDHARTVRALGEDFSPGPDDHRMPVGLAASGMHTALTCGDYVDHRFDGTHLKQRVQAYLRDDALVVEALK